MRTVKAIKTTKTQRRSVSLSSIGNKCRAVRIGSTHSRRKAVVNTQRSETQIAEPVPPRDLVTQSLSLSMVRNCAVTQSNTNIWPNRTIEHQRMAESDLNKDRDVLNII